jgi:hypothetical protein
VAEALAPPPDLHEQLDADGPGALLKLLADKGPAALLALDDEAQLPLGAAFVAAVCPGPLGAFKRPSCFPQ